MAESTSTRLIKAPRAKIYDTLVNCGALAAWLHPAGTSARLLECNPRIGGHLRMEITHAPGPEGTHRFDLTFADLRPGEAVVLRGAFESDDPDMARPMQLTFTLEDEPGGARLTLHHAGLPDSISIEDNQRGSASSLANRARLIEESSSK